MTVSDRIYKIIDEKGLKQYRVAQAASIPPKAFNEMLRGRRLIKAEEIPRICEALGVTPNDILGFTTSDQAS